MLAGGDADGAGRSVAQIGECRKFRFDLLEPRGDRAKQTLARFRRGDEVAINLVSRNVSPGMALIASTARKSEC